VALKEMPLQNLCLFVVCVCWITCVHDTRREGQCSIWLCPLPRNDIFFLKQGQRGKPYWKETNNKLWGMKYIHMLWKKVTYFFSQWSTTILKGPMHGRVWLFNSLLGRCNARM
jgi:hypothetical protein